MALADRLPDRERSLVTAAHAFRAGEFDRAEQLYRRVLADHPQDLEALNRLANLIFMTAGFRGRDWREVLPVSERFLALSPWWREGARSGVLEIGWECRFHLSQKAVLAGDWPRYDELGMAAIPGALWFQIQRAFGSGDARAQSDAMAALASSDEHVPLVVVFAFSFAAWPVHHDEVCRRIARLLLAPGRHPESHVAGHVLLAQEGVRGGRYQAACAHLDSAGRLDADRALVCRGHLTTLPFVPASAGELESLHEQLVAGQPARSVALDSDSLWRDQTGYEELTRLYLLGLVELALGRDEAVARCAAALDTLRTERDTGSSARDLALGLRARLARRAGDAAGALTLLETAERRVPLGLHWHNVILGQPAERLLRAELLAELERHDEARDWYESLFNGADVQFEAIAHLGVARCLTALDDRAGAVTRYDQFLAAMRSCDPEFEGLVAAARREREAARAGA
jgi:tetratricopeptide (TPR) repeat protein